MGCPQFTKRSLPLSTASRCFRSSEEIDSAQMNGQLQLTSKTPTLHHLIRNYRCRSMLLLTNWFAASAAENWLLIAASAASFLSSQQHCGVLLNVMCHAPRAAG